MQSKLLVILAFLAACSASLLGGNKILIALGSNDIVVANALGQQINIATNKLSTIGGLGWQPTIQIQVAGPDVIPQSIQIPDQQVGIAGQSQSAILYQILGQYSGVIDEITYQQLLTVIAQYVQAGQIDPVILNALQVASINSQGIHIRNPQISQLAAAHGTQGWYGQNSQGIVPGNWLINQIVGAQGPQRWSSQSPYSKLAAWSNLQALGGYGNLQQSQPSNVIYGQPAWTGANLRVDLPGGIWQQQLAGGNYGPYAAGLSQGIWGTGAISRNWWPSSNIWGWQQEGIPLGQQNLVPVLA